MRGVVTSNGALWDEIRWFCGIEMNGEFARFNLPRTDKNGKDIWTKDSDPAIVIGTHEYSQIIPISIDVRLIEHEYKLFIDFSEDNYIHVPLPNEFVESMNEICSNLKDVLPPIFRTYHNEKGFCWFLNDIVDLCKYFKLLNENGINYQLLYDIHSAEELYHNKFVAEIASFNILSGRDVELLFQKKNGQNPDLRVQDTFVEIKTIQPTRCLNITNQGILIREKEARSLSAKYRDQIEKGFKQVSGNGIVFVYFWCNSTNFILGNHLLPWLSGKFPDIINNRLITVIQSPYDSIKKFYYEIPWDIVEKKIDEIDTYLRTPIKASSLMIPLQPKGVGFTPHHRGSLTMSVLRMRLVKD